MRLVCDHRIIAYGIRVLYCTALIGPFVRPAAEPVTLERRDVYLEVESSAVTPKLRPKRHLSDLDIWNIAQCSRGVKESYWTRDLRGNGLSGLPHRVPWGVADMYRCRVKQLQPTFTSTGRAVWAVFPASRLVLAMRR